MANLPIFRSLVRHKVEPVETRSPETDDQNRWRMLNSPPIQNWLGSSSFMTYIFKTTKRLCDLLSTLLNFTNTMIMIEI
jgi:hypothetical protein